MKIENIWMNGYKTDEEYENKPLYMYVEKDGKLYRANLVPFRKLRDADLKEVRITSTKEKFIRASHLFRPTGSLLACLRFYGLEISK